jgi:hypothetical protein
MMKKELREPIKDPSIFENEYFKVVYKEHTRTLYVKCNKLTFSHIDSWVHNIDIDGFTIEEWHNNETHGSAYEILPKRCHFFMHPDDLETDIQFIPKEEFDEVKQRVIDMLS